MERHEVAKSSGKPRALHLPDRLYHGTTTLRMEAILADGLRDDLAKESALSGSGVYLAADPALAASVARRRATRHGGLPLVLSLASDALAPDLLRLDFNLAGGRFWSRSLVYGGPIPGGDLNVERWENLANLVTPTDFEDPEPGDGGIAFDPAWDRAGEFTFSAATGP